MIAARNAVDHRDALVAERLFQNHAAIELADVLAEQGLPGCLVDQTRQHQVLSPPRQFVVADEHVGAALVQVDPNAVAGPQQREAAARCRFR